MKKLLLTALVGSLFALPSFAQDGTVNFEKNRNIYERTEIAVDFQHNNKPVYSIESLSPLNKFTDTSKHVLFAQGRFAYVHDSGAVGTAGLNYRHISPSGNSLYGVNAFYDYGFKHGFDRASVGAEYFVGQNEFSANVYKGLSGQKAIDSQNTLFAEVSDGYDVTYARTFKNAAWARAYVKGYHWDNKLSDDVNGVRVGAKLQITPQIAIDAGMDKENRRSGEGFVKVMYNLSGAPVAYINGKHSFEGNPVRAKMLDRTDRDLTFTLSTKATPVVAPPVPPIQPQTPVTPQEPAQPEAQPTEAPAVEPTEERLPTEGDANIDPVDPDLQPEEDADGGDYSEYPNLYPEADSQVQGSQFG